MLLICLDGYDPRFAKDIKWKERFDMFYEIDTEDHTIPSNCWILTGHGTKIRKYMWDVGDKKSKLFSHEDLGGPFLWEKLEEKGLSQVWISIPIIRPLPKVKDAVFIPGVLSRPQKSDEKYLNILKKTKYSLEDLLELVELEFKIYLKYADRDFVYLYVFWLDPANHRGLTKPVKGKVDEWMEKIPLHSKTVVYSDHGRPGGGRGYVGHFPRGILGLKGISKRISHIKELHSLILEEV